MKVGIMSMQRIENYGSFLQAYSLKEMLEGVGHEVVFVDYKIEPCIVQAPPVIIKQISIPGRVARRVRQTVSNVIRTVNGEKESAAKLEASRLRNRYVDYVKQLGVYDERTEDIPVDVLVIGSDEVFNCLQTNPAVGYSRQLFGEGVNAEKVITYAACAGFTTSEGLERYGIKNEVAGMLKKNFSAISVRDDNTFALVKELTGITPERHVDPVLVGNFFSQIVEDQALKNYVVVYSYEERMSNRLDERDAIQSFAHKRGLRTVSIGNYQSWTDLHIEASPFELLGYIKNADYVITDTFHGTVFSIVLEKKFGTLVRESNVQKLTSLLQEFGLENRIISDTTKLDSVMMGDISFQKAKCIREEERKRSLSYLTNAIGDK